MEEMSEQFSSYLLHRRVPGENLQPAAFTFCAGLSSAEGVRASPTADHRSQERTRMSFLRHGEIYRFDIEPMTGSGNRCRRSQPLIGVDEFPVGYSLAGCPPAEPASASPTANSLQSPTPPHNDFSSNGTYPLNLVSQPKGALQVAPSFTVW